MKKKKKKKNSKIYVDLSVDSNKIWKEMKYKLINFIGLAEKFARQESI